MGPVGFLTMETSSEMERMVKNEEDKRKILLTWSDMKDGILTLRSDKKFFTRDNT